MADLSYTVEVNATPAIATLKKVEQQVKSVNDSFGKLKTALASLAMGAFALNALKTADAIQDLSDATGIATNVLLGFNNAVIQNGGDADKANTSILKFTQTINDAAEGGKEAQIAFQKIGVSLEDLRTLSEADLLQKSIEGIGKLDSATERMGAQVALFGKNARGINFQGVAGGMGSAVAGATQYATAIKAGADAQQSLEVNLKNLTQALLNVLEPLNRLVGGLNISVAAFESLVKVILYAGGAYLIFTRGLAAVKTVMDALSLILKTQGGLWGRVTAQIMLMVSAATSIYKGIGRATGAISGGTSALFSFSAAIAGLLRLLLRFTGVIGIVMAVAEAINFLSKQFFKFDIVDYATDKLKSFWEWGKKITGLGDLFGSSGAGAGRGGNDAITKQLQDRGEEMRKQSEQARETESYFRKQEMALKASVAQFYAANAQAAKMIDFEATMIGKTEDEVEMQRSLNDLSIKYTAEIQKLKDAKNQLGSEETALRKIYDDQIASLEKNKQADKDRLASSITGLQTARLLEQDRLNTLQRITDVMQKQKDISGVTSGIYSDMSKKINEIAFGKEQRGRSVFDQQEAQIKRNIQLLEADMAGAIMAAFETEDGYTNIQQMNTELEKMYALTAKLKQEQLSELNISNQWATGWQDAFTKYMDSATNAAKIAGEQFSAVTNGMNSAIDNFVENGKFSFKDMANSIIKDLLKIELKKQAAFALSGATSFLGSLFGGFFAEGGNPPINKPSVVGENGPELFVPKTAGTIIPNGGGTSNNNAPAGNTYITNNISAIDAKSVAQLFAENRKTLFGSVQMAQKELSYGR